MLVERFDEFCRLGRFQNDTRQGRHFACGPLPTKSAAGAGCRVQCDPAQLTSAVGQSRVFCSKFPAKWPLAGNFASETGSYLTAHTTIQSSQTARFRYDAK